MRLIDADALIRKFKTASPMAIDGRARRIVEDMPTIEPEPHSGRRVFQAGYEEGFEAGRKAGAHGRWIPCSERLPEKDGDYLVTFEKGYASDYDLDPIGIAPFEVDCEGFGFWQENFDMHTLGSLGSDWVDINVIAWMEKPEPYKEGES